MNSSPPSGSEPIRIFISYSHENEIWLTEWSDLIKQIPNPKYLLKLWERTFRKEKVTFWFDREPDQGLLGGESWRERIFEEIDKSRIAVLLVTQEFVTSPFIMDEELPRIFAKHKRGEMEILPLFLQPTRMKDLAEVDFLQFVPGGTPLSKHFETSQSGFDEARNQILDALSNLIHKSKNGRTKPDDPNPREPGATGTGMSQTAPKPVSLAPAPSATKIPQTIPSSESGNLPRFGTAILGKIQSAAVPDLALSNLGGEYEFSSPTSHSPRFGMPVMHVKEILRLGSESGKAQFSAESASNPKFRNAELKRKGNTDDV